MATISSIKQYHHGPLIFLSKSPLADFTDKKFRSINGAMPMSGFSIFIS